MKTHVLHICNDFLNSKVHANLYAALDFKGLKQTIFVPFRKGQEDRINKFEFSNIESSIAYSSELQEYYRAFFYKKIDLLYNDAVCAIKISNPDIAHATTLFSDGAVAYKLYQKYNIPYVVTVRNTDLNLFFKYMVHLRPLGLNILSNAKRIIFISPAYRRRIFEFSYIQPYITELEAKSVVVPNGIDPFWIEHVQHKKRVIGSHPNILYVGNFTRGKNVVNLVRAIDMLNKNSAIFNLNLVGSGGNGFKSVMKLVRGKKYINYWGKIADKNLLKQVFVDNDIFAMPSHHETFGLTYIEAMSQGLPILYTKGEGVDGFYTHSIGEAVDSRNVKEITSGINKIFKNYNYYDFDPKEIVKNHDWNKIAEIYMRIYQSERV